MLIRAQYWSMVWIKGHMIIMLCLGLLIWEEKKVFEKDHYDHLGIKAYMYENI